MRVGILIHLNEDVYECIRHAANLGFQSGQISIWDMSLYTEKNIQLVKQACEKFDFTITAVWCGWSGPVDWGYPNMYTTIGLIPSAWRSQRVKELLDGAAFARALGVKNIITHLGFLPDNPMDEERLGVVQAVRYICREIEKYGQNFCFETGEELPSTLVQFIHDVNMPNVGVNFDPANLLINARANSADGLEMLAPYVRGFHGKDGLYPQGGKPKGKEVVVGQGQANFPVLIEKLVRMGYKGDITIEREIPEGEVRDREILEEKAYLENLIKGAVEC